MGFRYSTRWTVLAARRSPRRAAACCPPGSLVARLLAWRRGADRRMKLPLLAGCATLSPATLPCEERSWPHAPCRINRASQQCPKLAAHDEGARKEGIFSRSWMPLLAGVPSSAVFCWRCSLLAAAARSLSYARSSLSYACSSLDILLMGCMPSSNLLAAWAI
ncbi:hypothetical protein Dimus_017900 [Dionaea muscipula]